MSGFTPLLFAYVFTAVFLAGIVRGATGFGFSMIMIVLLTLFFPPAQVAPVILFWEVLASIGHLPFVYKQVHWKSLRWLALGVALGTPFGVYCLISIPVDAMRLILNRHCRCCRKSAILPPSSTALQAPIHFIAPALWVKSLLTIFLKRSMEIFLSGW